MRSPKHPFPDFRLHILPKVPIFGYKKWQFGCPNEYSKPNIHQKWWKCFSTFWFVCLCLHVKYYQLLVSNTTLDVCPWGVKLKLKQTNTANLLCSCSGALCLCHQRVNWSANTIEELKNLEKPPQIRKELVLGLTLTGVIFHIHKLGSFSRPM